MTACGAKPPPAIEIQVDRVKPDAAILTCLDAPATPGEKATDLQAAIHTLALWAAYADCKAKLGAVKAFVDAPPATQ